MRKLMMSLCLLLAGYWSHSAPALVMRDGRAGGNGRDTLRVKAGMVVLLRDSFYVAQRDTILIPGTEKVRLRKDPYAHSRTFYDSLAVHSNRNRLIMALYKVFIRDNAPVNTTSKNSRSREDELAAADGKVIRSLRSFNVPLLDGDVRDTAWITRSPVSRLISFHPQTRKKLILSSLLLEVGERTDGEALADAERLIRALPSIRDAELYILPTDHPDSIDIVVVAQDVFPIRAGIGIDATDKYKVTLADKNIDGRALELSGLLEYRPGARYETDYRLTLRKANVLGRYIDVEAEAAGQQQRKTQFLSFDRGFLSEDLPDMGGFRFGGVQDEWQPETLASRYQRWQLGGWYGRVLRGPASWNLIPAVAAEAGSLQRTPQTTTVPYTLRDRWSVLGSLNLLRREFIRTALVTRFGVSEYFPVGEALQLTGGREGTNAFGRNYLAAGATFARFLNDAGFFGINGNYAAFYQTRRAEDIRLRADLYYFSPLLKWGRVRLRQFATIRYQSLRAARFLSPLPVEGVKIAPEGSATVAQEYTVYGIQSIWHMPWYVYGFRFAFFQAVDLYSVEWKGARQHVPVLSAGVRFRNEYLVYSTFSVQVQWQPEKYGRAELLQVRFTSVLPQVFNGLGVSRPALPY